MNKHLKKISLVLTAFLLLAGFSAPAQAATKLTQPQQAKVSAVFKAIASSNPDSMSLVGKNLSGSAKLAVAMIQNYYSTEKYMRSVSSVGRPLGVTPANAAAGTAKITNGKVVLTTAAPGFSGTYSDFKFDKSGKISSWSISSSGGTKVNIAYRVKALPKVTWQYANDIKAIYWGKGVQMDSGTIYQDSLGRWIIQLSVTNVAGGNNTKSLIATTGNYQSPDKKLFATTSTPVGCFETGQTVYFTSVVPAGAVILSGVKGLLEIPMSNGCTPDDSNRLEVTIQP
ncbi:MAG: hypothetical protein RIS18_164 [Actinomycetota bacterium]|jgi:hypothetical protein